MVFSNPFSNPFKLEKLSIKAFTKLDRSGKEVDSFELPFNPATLSVHYENRFKSEKAPNSSGRPAKYSYSNTAQISLKFILDGTGVNDFELLSFLGGSKATVGEQISKFLDLCYVMDGTIHQPKYLKIQWGDGVLQDFNCRLKSVDIAYTLFNKNGETIRAELDTVFVEDGEPNQLARKEGKKSPDVSHSRLVKSGDTLPLLCKEIYGSPNYYIRVAQYNKLDNFRSLTPGQTLIFPPLET